CDLCRFETASSSGTSPDDVRIDRECYLGTPGAFANIRVSILDRAPYFVEVKSGYSNESLVARLRHKYGTVTTAHQGASQVVLVVDSEGRPDWPGTEAKLRDSLPPGWNLEVWNERQIIALVKKHLGIELRAVAEGELADLARELDEGKSLPALGTDMVAGLE